jgi:sulfur relay (sulfurtransferase) complex TusBCD TusD component (DsrE family)
MRYPRLCCPPFDNKFNVKVLVIVNSGPWSGSLGVTALRLVRGVSGTGASVAAVYFREDGIYQALPSRAHDAGTPDLRDGWLELAERDGFPLLLCSSASQRRLEHCPRGGFREAGRAEVLALMGECDRVVSL